MTDERDMAGRPYTADEVRVAAFLHDRAPDIGAGDDPIGFLLASYAFVIDRQSPAHEFGGYSASEVAELCDGLARSADRAQANSYQEIASISRRARDAIQFLLGGDVQPDNS